MVNLNADPPQGRDDSQQLRTTGRFSIPFIAGPQGIGGVPSEPTAGALVQTGSLSALVQTGGLSALVQTGTI